MQEKHAGTGPYKQIMRQLGGVHATHLLHVGLAEGLFDTLARRPGLSPKALSTTLGLNGEAVRAWCLAAFALGFLETRGEAFAVPEPYRPILVERDDPCYVGPLVAFISHLSKHYDEFAALMLTGQQTTYEAQMDGLEPVVAGLTRHMPAGWMKALDAVAPGWDDRLRAGGRVLDIGCGGGPALVEMARRWPASALEGADPSARNIELARASLRRAGLEQRVVLSVARAEQECRDAVFDLITMTLTLHLLAEPQQRPVLGNCLRALRPGGTLALVEENYSEEVSDLRLAHFRASAVMQCMKLTWGARPMTGDRVRTLVAEAGFGDLVAAAFDDEKMIVWRARR